MKKYNDTDLRKALERTEAKRRPAEVPDDFLANVLDEIESEAKPKTIKIWRWVAAAACIAIVVGLGAIIALNRQTTPQPAVAIIADTSSSIDQTPSQPAIAETEIAPVPVAAPEPKSEPAPAKPKRQNKKAQPKPAPDNQQQVAETIVAEQPTTDTESNFFAPAKMDEAIAMMADHQHAEKQDFECEHDEEYDVEEMLYVFDDNDDFDLLGNLILSACHFDENTSGYFLNYSQQKFFFSINDENSGRTYTWIADRISNGRTLLYCANAPEESNATSDCYTSFIHKTSLKNMNSYSNL